MRKIEIKIEIPEETFKDWGDFENYGIEGVKRNLLHDFKNQCDNLGIEYYRIDVTDSK